MNYLASSSVRLSEANAEIHFSLSFWIRKHLAAWTNIFNVILCVADSFAYAWFNAYVDPLRAEWVEFAAGQEWEGLKAALFSATAVLLVLPYFVASL